MNDSRPADQLSPRHRMWLWIWSTLLATPAIIGLAFILARITAIPLITLFAPCFLLAHLAPESSRLLTAYLLMPIQCVTYGLLLARSELKSRRNAALLALVLIHLPLALLALYLTRGQI